MIGLMGRTGHLRQRDPGDGAWLLQDYPADLVAVDCPTCGRAGAYRKAALIARHGPRAGLPDILWRCWLQTALGEALSASTPTPAARGTLTWRASSAAKGGVGTRTKSLAPPNPQRSWPAITAMYGNAISGQRQ